MLGELIGAAGYNGRRHDRDFFNPFCTFDLQFLVLALSVANKSALTFTSRSRRLISIAARGNCKYRVPIAVALIQKRGFPVLHGLELGSEFKNHLGSDVIDLLLLLQNLRVIRRVVDQEGISFLEEIKEALIQDREQRILLLREDPTGLIPNHRIGSIEHRRSAVPPPPAFASLHCAALPAW